VSSSEFGVPGAEGRLLGVDVADGLAIETHADTAMQQLSTANNVFLNSAYP
jgi:hypothetical protein